MKRITSEQSLISTGLTDGSVLIYEVRDSGLVLRHKHLAVHGFGVNVMDTCTITDTSFAIVTGGDDQHISVLLYKTDGGQIVKLGGVKKYAHSSCVKGLVLRRADGHIYVESSGYD